ncbi:MAG: hypothetical protein WC887_02810 [Candidatus Paceibacterota bacterium]|jgi:Tfp pilus assembly protein PilN
MLPPTIPTSFVPRSASAVSRRSSVDLTGMFGFISYIILGIVFILAVGVFLYGQLLSNNQKTKDEALAKAEAAIDPSIAQEFVRLRNRLSSGKMLLENHKTSSDFFTALESVMPSTVSFTSLNLSLNDKGIIEFQGLGVAKNFNALAAASMSFAKDGRIKNAIFSGITVNSKDNSVSFALTATFDPKPVNFSL